MIYTVTYSPCDDDEVPFSYEENGFVRWVDEVFLEGYKKGEGAPFPTAEECIDLLEAQGYVLEARDE